MDVRDPVDTVDGITPASSGMYSTTIVLGALVYKVMQDVYHPEQDGFRRAAFWRDHYQALLRGFQAE